MIHSAKHALLMDSNTQGKISVFYFARLLLISLVLLSTTFLKQEVLGADTIEKIYMVLSVSFFISFMNVSFWEETLRVGYFMPSQLLYDLLLTSYLVYLTGVNDSVFLFLYLLNIVFASVVYQLNGALMVASLSGLTFAFIYYANVDMDSVSAWYSLAWQELFFLLTALLCGQFMDELKRQKQLLDRQRQNIARLELLNDRLLNSLPVGVVLVDSQEYVKKVNQTALRLLKLHHAPEMRIKYYELMPELKGIFGAWQKMTEGQKLRYLFRLGPGQTNNLSLKIVDLPQNEAEDLHHIMAITDESKTLELEHKLELETKLAATGELAAGIAHEIRNPLASISGSIELLASHLNIENEQDKRLLEISLREIRRLNTLITDFLEFAKPKDNSQSEFPLHEVVAEVSDALQSRSKETALEVLSTIPLDLIACANRERMKQVFFNLFLNSIEAGNGGEVQITINCRTVADGKIVIDFRDNGPGVDQSVAERIFDPFFTTKAEGTGLGLSTVAQILRAAKGEVRLVESPRGAHFRLTLPGFTYSQRASSVS